MKVAGSLSVSAVPLAQVEQEVDPAAANLSVSHTAQATRFGFAIIPSLGEGGGEQGHGEEAARRWAAGRTGGA